MAKITILPPDLNNCKSYENFKLEVNGWSSLTDLAEEKQGLCVALHLPNESKFGKDLKDKVLENISLEELKSREGLTKLFQFLDKEIGKDDIEDVTDKWDSFQDCKRLENQSFEEYIRDFELKYNRVKCSGTVLGEDVLAYMLIKRSWSNRHTKNVGKVTC